MGPICLRQVRPPEMTHHTPNYFERMSLLSSTGTTTTLADENFKFLSKLRAISTETPKNSTHGYTKPTKATASASSTTKSSSKKKVSKHK